MIRLILSGLLIWTVSAAALAQTSASRGRPLLNALRIAPAQLSSAPDVLLVGIGGWGSCAKGETPKQQVIGSGFLRTLKSLRAARPDISFNYFLACAPSRLSIVGSRLFDIEFSKNGRSYRQKFAEGWLWRKIRRVRQSPQTKIIVMGHSHGGYSAMKVARHLPVFALHTIEPVSAARCGVLDYIRNRERKLRIMKAFKREVIDCRRTPRDLNWGIISRNVNGQWFNHILAPGRAQRSNGPLYSSPIANHLASNMVHAVPGNTPHHSISMVGSVWDNILRQTLASL